MVATRHFQPKKMAGVILWDTFWQEEDFFLIFGGKFLITFWRELEFKKI
jgi:hypothetical protein